jgi:hypothetical protein
MVGVVQLSVTRVLFGVADRSVIAKGTVGGGVVAEARFDTPDLPAAFRTLTSKL